MEENDHLQDDFVSIPYGAQLQYHHEHGSKYFDVQAITYNSKHHKYIILDSRGIRSLVCSFHKNVIKTELSYESYKFNIFRDILYCRAFDIYFILTKEFQLKIYNINFHETFVVESDGTSVTCLMYNTKQNELITVGHNKLRFWQLASSGKNSNPNQLVLSREYEISETLLISNAYFDEFHEKIFLLSDYDVLCYKYNGNMAYRVKNASSTHLSICVYSHKANYLVTGAISGQLDFFSSTGSKIKSLLNHTSIVTALLLHPSDPDLLISSSLDGSIIFYSFHLLQELFSVSSFPNGVQWMKLQSKHSIYAGSSKSIKIYNINIPFSYWGFVNSAVHKINVIPKNKEKTSHVTVFAKDNSIKIYQSKNGKRKLTVLPPPELPVDQQPLSVTYDRKGGVLYVLFDMISLWVYITKTDPATRVATWNISESINNVKFEMEKSLFGKSMQSSNLKQDFLRCHCLATIERQLILTNETDPLDSGCDANILLCGLSNGILLFLDPFKNGDVIKTLQCHFTSPVLKIIVDVATKPTQLLTIIKTATEFLFQVWQVESMVLLKKLETTSLFYLETFKNNILSFSNNQGSLTILEISDLKSKSAFSLVNNSFEHKGKILSIDVHIEKDILCTSGTDKYIRIWTFNKCLLYEIELDDTLYCAAFLNNQLDIIAGFKSNLFIIRSKDIPVLKNNKYSIDDDTDSNESFVYEDLYSNSVEQEKLSNDNLLSNYLNPYPHLELDKNWQNKTILDTKIQQKISESIETCFEDNDYSDTTSFADTDIYQDTIESCSITSDDVEFPKYIMSPELESIETEEEIQSNQDILQENVIALNEMKSSAVVNVKDQILNDNFAKENLSNRLSANLVDRINNLQLITEPKSSVMLPKITKNQILKKNNKRKTSLKAVRSKNVLRKKSKNMKEIATGVDENNNMLRIKNPNSKNMKEIANSVDDNNSILRINQNSQASLTVSIKENIKKNKSMSTSLSKTSNNMNKYKSKSIHNKHSDIESSQQKINVNKNNLDTSSEKKSQLNKNINKKKILKNIHDKNNQNPAVNVTNEIVKQQKIDNRSSKNLQNKDYKKTNEIARDRKILSKTHLLNLPVSRPRSLTAMALGQYDETISKSFKSVFSTLLGEKQSINDSPNEKSNEVINRIQPPELEISAQLEDSIVQKIVIVKNSEEYINSKISDDTEIATDYIKFEENKLETKHNYLSGSNQVISNDKSDEIKTDEEKGTMQNNILSNKNKVKKDKSFLEIKPYSYDISSLKDENFPEDRNDSTLDASRSSILAIKKKLQSNSKSFARSSSPSKKIKSHFNDQSNNEVPALESFERRPSSISVTISEKSSGILVEPINQPIAKASAADEIESQNDSCKIDNTVSSDSNTRKQIEKFIVGAFKTPKKPKKVSTEVPTNNNNKINFDSAETNLPLKQTEKRKTPSDNFAVCNCETTSSSVKHSHENIYSMKNISKEYDVATNHRNKVSSCPNQYDPEFIMARNSLEKLNFQPVTKISFHRARSSELTVAKQCPENYDNILLEKNRLVKSISPQQMDQYLSGNELPPSSNKLANRCSENYNDILLEKNPILKEKLRKHKEKKNRLVKSISPQPIDQFFSENEIPPSSNKLNQQSSWLQNKPKSNMVCSLTSSSSDKPIDINRKVYCFTPSREVFTPISSSETIRLLENKLSGTSHRYHQDRSSEDIINKKIQLEFLKNKEAGFNRLPIGKSSISIPVQQRSSNDEFQNQKTIRQQRIVSPHFKKKRTISLIKQGAIK